MVENAGQSSAAVPVNSEATGTSPAVGTQRLVSIDVLRGIAILGVVCVHMPNDAPGGWRLNPWFFPSLLMRYGYLGVPLFILISGFCIHRRAAMTQAPGMASINWLAFWKRRFWRLYPPYVAAIVLGITIPWLTELPSPAQNSIPGDYLFSFDVITHLLMVHNLTQEYAVQLQNGVYWTLGLEEQLYGLYPLLLLLIPRTGHWGLLWIVGAVTLLWQLVLPLLPTPQLTPHVHLGSYSAWPFMYWFHWALGAVAVALHFDRQSRPAWVLSIFPAAILLTAGAILNRNLFALAAEAGWSVSAIVGPYSRELQSIGGLLLATGFFCVMLWLTANEMHWVLRGRLSRSLASIGQISYSVYLVHFPVILVVREAIQLQGNGWQWPVRTFVFLSTSLLAGFVFHQGVERWFLAGRCPFRLRPA